MIRVRGDYIKRILLIASFILMGTVHVFAAQLGEGWLPVRLDMRSLRLHRAVSRSEVAMRFWCM